MTRINLAAAESVCERNCGETQWFKCGACARKVCACTGAADEYPELCSTCWSIVIGNIALNGLAYFDDTTPDGMANEQIRLMKLMFDHGTLA